MSIQDTAEEGADKLKAILTKKVGPLPVGGWLAGGIGGVLIAMYLRRRGATEEEVSPEDAYGGTTQPGAGNLGEGGGGSGGGTTARPTTNEEWWTKATEAILAEGGYTGTAVTTALTKYLAGEALTNDEQAIVNLAIRLVGPPPYPPPLPLPGIPTPQPDPVDPDPPAQPQPGNNPTPPPPAPAAPKSYYYTPNTNGGGGQVAQGQTTTDTKAWQDALKKEEEKKKAEAAKPKTSSVTAPKPAPKPKVKIVHYTTKKGDTLSKIGQKYGVSWQKIWDYNTDTKNRTAAAIKTIKSRGPNGLVAGSLFLVPVPA